MDLFVATFYWIKSFKSLNNKRHPMRHQYWNSGKNRRYPVLKYGSPSLVTDIECTSTESTRLNDRLFWTRFRKHGFHFAEILELLCFQFFPWVKLVFFCFYNCFWILLKKMTISVDNFIWNYVFQSCIQP